MADKVAVNNSFEDIGGIDDFKEQHYEKIYDGEISDKLINQNESTRILECGVCHKQFKKLLIYKKHQLKHKKNYACSCCNKTFRLLTTLKQHNTVHNTDQPYSCESCKKSFNRVSSLILHRKIHDSVKLFACPLCEKSFHQKGNLKNHLYTHTNLRPYKCDYCEKGFNQMSNLVCHKQKNHSNQIINPWLCSICKMEFSKREELRKHGLETHRNQIDLSKPLEKFYSRKNARLVDQKFEDHFLLSSLNPTPQNLTMESSTIIGENNKTVPPISIIIKSIKTEAMEIAKKNGETPFGVLHFLNGPPLLVRCIAVDEDSTMLTPANQDDLERLKQYKKPTNQGYVSIVARIYQISTSTGESLFKIKAPKNIYKFPNSSEKYISEQDNNVSIINNINIIEDIKKVNLNINMKKILFSSIKQDLSEDTISTINLKMNANTYDSNWDKNLNRENEFKLKKSDNDYLQITKYNEGQTEIRKNKIGDQLSIKPFIIYSSADLIENYKEISGAKAKTFEHFPANDFKHNNNYPFQENSSAANEENDMNLINKFLQGNFHECEGFNDIISEFLNP